LGFTIRIAHGIGLHVAEQEEGLLQEEIEHRRKVWYCLYILDRLVALQLGGAVMIRDSDFTVRLPSDTLDIGSLSPEISYLRHTAGLSKIIGDVIDRIYRPGQAAIHLDQLLETIAALDSMLLSWRNQLSPHLRFFNAHPFESNVMFKRQVVPKYFVPLVMVEELFGNQVSSPSYSHTSPLSLFRESSFQRIERRYE
jgi:hypothetical protein